MPRDYKNRAATKKKPPQQQTSVVWWKWLLITLIITLFIIFLVFLKNSSLTPEKPESRASSTSKSTKKTPKHQDNEKKEPRYDFYTILPETEVVVPDYEIKTRSREEQLGKRKSSKYVVQAGSFRHFSEADKLKAELAFVGIESKVEKAIVNGVAWNRVKIGPYSRSSQIAKIKKQLNNNGIDAIVLEVRN